MKKKTVTVKVASPCHENLAKMAVVQAGRFCKNCNKVVQDFTNFTDKELAAYFKNNPKGCGMFYADQLNRPMPVPVEGNNSLLFKAVLGGALVAGLSSEANGQVITYKTENVQVPVPVPLIVTEVKKDSTATDSIVHEIKGMVIYAKEKWPAENYLITIEGTLYEVKTDENGKFTFKVPKELEGKPIVLKNSENRFTGYRPDSIRIKGGNYPANVKFVLKERKEHRGLFPKRYMVAGGYGS